MKQAKDHNVARHGCAFTLLEMLTATALMAVLTVAVLSSLHIGFNARATAQRRAEPAQRLTLAMEMIQNDLHTALPVSGDLVTECIGEDRQDGTGRDRDSLTLFNAAPYMPWPDHPVGLRRVKFVLGQTVQDDAPVLVREIIENTLAPIEPQPRVEVLCRGVRSLNLRYYDGSDWADTWDSSSRDNTLPLAVELTIELQTQQENQEEDQAETGPRLTTIVTIPCGEAVTGEGGRVKR